MTQIGSLKGIRFVFTANKSAGHGQDPDSAFSNLLLIHPGRSYHLFLLDACLHLSRFYGNNNAFIAQQM